MLRLASNEGIHFPRKFAQARAKLGCGMHYKPSKHGENQRKARPRVEWLEPRRMLTVLSFDVPVDGGEPIPGGYGQNVSSSSNGEYTYAQNGEGFTPNTTVRYLENNGGTIRAWGSGFGDLQNVAYADSQGDGILRVLLSGDPAGNTDV